jgi:DNA-binding transcriptional ArsR family regulator
LPTVLSADDSVPFDALRSPADIEDLGCVNGALAERFSISRPAVSRHLRVLQDAGLVNPSERGAQNIYSIRVQGFRNVHEFIDSFWDVALSQLEQLAKR